MPNNFGGDQYDPDYRPLSRRARAKKKPRHTTIHWLFKVDPTYADADLCETSVDDRATSGSIILRPVIRQEARGPLRECSGCARIGRALGIP